MRKGDVAFDLEVYPNYLLAAFKQVGKNGVVRFRLVGEDAVLSDSERAKLVKLLRAYRIFGFNSLNYDLPIVLMMLRGDNVKSCHERGNEIIENNQNHYLTMRKLNLDAPNFLSHFDISDVAVGVRVSLKLYGGRIHAPKLQDLPIHPNTVLRQEQMDAIDLYNVNDLDTTILLYQEIKEAIDLRHELSNTYGIDFMSKSDPQVAEHLIVHQVSKLRGRNVSKPSSIPTHIRYDVPEYIKFTSPVLRQVLEFVRSHEFEIDDNGSVVLPDVLAKNSIVIGDTEYQMGIGGLHSKDKCLKVVPNENQLLLDRDVTSYYPHIILNLGLYPKQMGTHFLEVYRRIVEDRVESKRLISILKDPKELAYHENRAACYKIVANGSFGKFGSKYSKLYSPELMAKVTLTGQLALLMLIERLNELGISVLSANTDGFVSLMDKSLYAIYDTACFDWMLSTGFNLEETSYKGLYSRDVNNYFAVTQSGKIKGKGVYGKTGLGKNPNARIVAEAVMAKILDDVPFMTTLKDCKDFTKFLIVRTVNGGAQFNGELLGRVVRWVYTTSGEVITYAKNGNKVPKSDGGEPFQNLPESFPTNLDYARYEAECQKLLASMGEDYLC